MEKRKIKDLCIIIGLLIFLIFSFISVYYLGINKYNHKMEEIKIEEFFEEQEEYVSEITDEIKEIETKQEEVIKYTMILEIPDIGLQKGIFCVGLLSNTVSKNIEMLKESTMPDIDKGNVILAAHNGTSSVSYFNKLDKLNVGDKINLYYNGTKYEYILSNSYEIEKTGTAIIKRDKFKTTITLLTCKKNSKDKQIVYVAYLNNTSKY